MRAIAADKSGPPRAIAKQHQILAQDTNGCRLSFEIAKAVGPTADSAGLSLKS